MLEQASFSGGGLTHAESAKAGRTPRGLELAVRSIPTTNGLRNPDGGPRKTSACPPAGTARQVFRQAGRATSSRFRRVSGSLRAFTLIELLTVVFIISLLIGLLIPSINGARNAAKKAATKKALKAIDVALEMFKNDNGRDFRQTNGYPPSFSHPPIPGYNFDPLLGQFPFLDPVSQSNPPTVYGAHWLPAMLMGADRLGYVKRGDVPRNLRQEPWCWYPNPDPTVGQCTNQRPMSTALYLDQSNVKTVATGKLTGRAPKTGGLFPDMAVMASLPVLVDAFDQPILYYAASTHGRTTNMVGDIHEANNNYTGGIQQEGIPYYFHQDNEGFTGTDTDGGFDFGGRPVGHTIAKSGAKLDPSQLVLPDNKDTFARYVMDRNIFAANPGKDAPLRPVNADSYLLITAGPDGRYGTNDDVTNLPPWPN